MKTSIISKANGVFVAQKLFVRFFSRWSKKERHGKSKVTERLKQAVNDPGKIFQSISKELKQALEQKLKEEQKLSNEVKQKKAPKKSQRQDQGKGQRPT